MPLEILKWIGSLAVVLAVWSALSELRLWWRLRFRSPRYLVILSVTSVAMGAGLAYLEYRDEGRAIAYLLFLAGLPGLVVLGFLLHGGPSEYLRMHPLTDYPNGVRSGSTLRLKSDLPIHDHEGRPTGDVIAGGEAWLALPGSILEPYVVWLRQPDGQVHTWDSQSLLDYFEIEIADADPAGSGPVSTGGCS